MDLISAETRGAVGILFLNRPEALNALNHPLMDQFEAVLGRFENGAAESCLAHSDVAVEDHESLAAVDAIAQKFMGAIMGFAAIEIVRVRRQTEWGFRQPVIFFIHRQTCQE